MFSAEGTGKNIEQAIDNALFELKAPREDVDIKVISEGGLFKKAKVIVTISEDAIVKYQKKYDEKKEEEKAQKDLEKQKEKVAKKEEKAAKKEEKEEVKLEKKAAIKEEKLEKEEIKESFEEASEEKDAVAMDPEEFLQGFFKAAGKEIEIKIVEDENYITYCVEGENLGDMIGHHGDCYYAINRLLAAVTGKQEKRVLLDIGGYRQKRAETLAALAKRTADRVAKSGRYSRLDPMNAAERRIIHSTLAEDDRVTTLSKGEEPRRYVMIFPKDE